MMKKLLAASALVTATIGAPVLAQEPFQLTSTDIGEGQQLAMKHVLNSFGCSGDNVSPSLQWSGAPEGTKSFVITVYDPDAPTGSGWWHWAVFNIPAEEKTLPQGAGAGEGIPAGAVQSRTDFGSFGFGGACPPPGEVHRYEFRVHALSVEKLDLDENASPALVGFMTYANTIATAKITAVYTR